MPRLRSSLPDSSNNLIAFWLLGLCNNFGYVIMLSAAKDILEPGPHLSNSTIACVEDRRAAKCSSISTGAVLLADILPSLLIKMISPFVFASISYNIRHLIVVILQACSFIVVASSNSPIVGLTGVILASIGCGLGDITLLPMSSHFAEGTITSWSSGTGAAGIFGALTYASLTDKNLLNFTPQAALFSMLLVPLLFGFTFYCILRSPITVHKANFLRFSTYFIPIPLGGESDTASIYSNASERHLLHESDDEDSETPVVLSKWEIVKPLIFPYMLPLCAVYFAEYFINQGLVELLVFDCLHGFNLSPTAQYRWYQVLYQIGVFVSRSSVGIFLLSQKFLPVLAILQLINSIGFVAESLHHSINYIHVVFVWILYEGVLGGLAYANTFKLIHKNIPKQRREFSMAFVTMSDALGIAIAGFLAIPVHNLICSNN